MTVKEKELIVCELKQLSEIFDNLIKKTNKNKNKNKNKEVVKNGFRFKK